MPKLDPIGDAEEEESRDEPVRRAGAWTEQVRQGLRRELKLSPLRQGEVSRRLGMGEGYLANLFTTLQGRKPIPLRLDTALAILAILGIRPSRFFAELESRGGWFEPAAEPPEPSGAQPVPRTPLQEISAAEYEEVGRQIIALARTVAGSLAPTPPSGGAQRRRKVRVP